MQQSQGAVSVKSNYKNDQNVNEKREQNRSALISQLAVELLSAIFLEVRTSTLLEAKYGHNSDNSRHYLGAKGWIRVSHVCHQWRSVAIGLQQLWSLIRVDPEDYLWAAELLSRSRKFPVTVYVDLSIDEDFELDDESRADTYALLNTKVKENLPRIKELRMRRLDFEDLRTFFSTQLSAPLLESFRIACLPLSVSSIEPPFILNDQLFHAPALKKLSVVCCQTDWDSQLFQSLTHLRVCYPPDGHRVTISRFLDVLSQISRLESLSLRDAFKKGADNTSIRTITKDKVKLPFLQDIQLRMTMDYLADFLPTIDIPCSSMIRIESFWDRQDSRWHCHDYNRIVQTLSTILNPSRTSQSNTKRPPIRTLRITRSDLEDITVQGFYEVLSHEQMEKPKPNFHPPLDFHFSWEVMDTDDSPLEFYLASEALWPLLEALPLEDLVNLEVGADLNIDHEIWEDEFGALPILESILLEDTTTSFDGLFCALGMKGGFPPFFQTLKTIVLQESETYVDIDWVVDVLIYRNQFDYPIENLSLPSSFKFDQADGDFIKIGGCNVRFTDDNLDVWQEAENDSDSDDDMEIGVQE